MTASLPALLKTKCLLQSGQGPYMKLKSISSGNKNSSTPDQSVLLIDIVRAWVVTLPELLPVFVPVRVT